MPLIPLPRTDVDQLWAYFFAEKSGRWATSIRESIHLAVFASGERLYAHWNDEKHSAAAHRNELVKLGTRLLDATMNFKQVLREEPAQLTVDMQGNQHVYVVPFIISEGIRRTHDTEVNTFLVLYGGVNASVAALKFEELSKVGWDQLQSSLVRD